MLIPRLCVYYVCFGREVSCSQTSSDYNVVKFMFLVRSWCENLAHGNSNQLKHFRGMSHVFHSQCFNIYFSRSLFLSGPLMVFSYETLSRTCRLPHYDENSVDPSRTTGTHLGFRPSSIVPHILSEI